MASGILKEKIGFTKKSIIKSKNVDVAILEMRLRELESENFRNVTIFLDRYDRRLAVEKEKILFELLEKGNFERLRNLLNSLEIEELNSNVYLRTAKKALRKIQFNCSKRIIKLNQDLYTDESQEVGEMTFDLSEGMEGAIINKVNTSIDIVSKDGKEEIEVLDDINIKSYREYNEIVDRVNKMMAKLYYIVFGEMAGKLSIVVDDVNLTSKLNSRKLTIKYHLDEEMSKLFRNEEAKVETLKGTVYSREQIVNMSLYSFSTLLNRMNLETQKQKVYPN